MRRLDCIDLVRLCGSIIVKPGRGRRLQLPSPDKRIIRLRLNGRSRQRCVVALRRCDMKHWLPTGAHRHYTATAVTIALLKDFSASGTLFADISLHPRGEVDVLQLPIVTEFFWSLNFSLLQPF